MFSRLHNWVKLREKAWHLSMGSDISTPAARARARRHYAWLDHGILRKLWNNCHQIAPGAWRSNQPSEERLKVISDMGIGTILCLRGDNKLSPFLFEKEACEALGMTLSVHALSARNLAPRHSYLKLLDTFETIGRPFLMHCKSGADRAGLASALYLLHMTDTPIEIAKKQLGIKYIHLNFTDTGILDFMLDCYQRDTKDQPMPIRTWLETRYDRDVLTANYRDGRKMDRKR